MIWVAHQLIQPCKDPYKWGSVVGACLSLHVIPTLIIKVILAVWSTHKGPNKDIGVGLSPPIPIVIPLGAPYEPLVLLVGHYGCPPMVNIFRVLWAEPDQVAHAQWVGPQDVVGLGLGEFEELIAAHRPAGADEGVGGDVVRIDGGKEGCSGDILHVVPLADVEEA